MIGSGTHGHGPINQLKLKTEELSGLPLPVVCLREHLLGAGCCRGERQVRERVKGPLTQKERIYTKGKSGNLAKYDTVFIVLFLITLNRYDDVLLKKIDIQTR